MNTSAASTEAPFVAVIGAGPAGLMAAETLVAGGVRVQVYDAMPSVGRKFLMAGRGGLNLTHAEAYGDFLERYGHRRDALAAQIDAFGPQALRAWVEALGIPTFVGSSGRVFPREMKAAPLLRAWLQRLRAAGVGFSMRHRWLGWDAHDTLRFTTPAGEQQVNASATVLALGGGSWPRLGSDAAWVPLLGARGVAVLPLQPANCGFERAWSEHFRTRFAGSPLKSAAFALPADARADAPAGSFRRGECMIAASGIEGSAVYAVSACLRQRIAQQGHACLFIDLLPDVSAQRVADEVARPRGSRSLSSHLQSRLGLGGVKTGLLREVLDPADMAQPARLASTIKCLPLRLDRARPLAEAISSAGGVPFEALDANGMLASLPGVFCAGEMLDWEAPTGGYLLTACFANGRATAEGVLRHLKHG